MAAESAELRTENSTHHLSLQFCRELVCPGEEQSVRNRINLEKSGWKELLEITWRDVFLRAGLRLDFPTR